MKYFNLILLLFIFNSSLYSQTLFQESFNDKSADTNQTETAKPLNLDSSTPSSQSTPQPKLTKSSVVTSSKKTQSNKQSRYLSTNLESLMLRGDIQLLYELSKPGGWAGLYYAHVNPQQDYNQITGDVGVAIGGRYYMDGYFEGMPLFLQSLIGFNRNNDEWDLNISVHCGQRITWKENLFVEVSAVLSRSYATEESDPKAYLNVGLSFKFDQPLLPFL